MQKHNYIARQQANEITRQAFNNSDYDHSNTITIDEFYPFLKSVLSQMGVYRDVTQMECENLFRFYDDDRNGFLTAN